MMWQNSGQNDFKFTSKMKSQENEINFILIRVGEGRGNISSEKPGAHCWTVAIWNENCAWQFHT